jgi:hypothetical protein
MPEMTRTRQRLLLPPATAQLGRCVELCGDAVARRENVGSGGVALIRAAVGASDEPVAGSTSTASPDVPVQVLPDVLGFDA